MRPRLQSARDQLPAVLGRRSVATASELMDALQVSRATLHRLLKEAGGQVVAAGKAQQARYALRRAIRGEAADLPLYEVDAQGRAELIAVVAPVSPQGCHASLVDAGWPVPDESVTGWWDGLPYPLYDMRPQGYMGRQIARAEHRALGVSENLEDWTDDEVLFVLARVGADVSGSLILGNAAYEGWLARKLSPLPALRDEPGPAYEALAEQAIAAGVPGSSAAGEFPKFAAMRDLPDARTPHVLVKFSGNDDSPAVRRWADLLVCEHLALQCAAALAGVRSPPSRIVRHGGRTFLEVERFDRHGLHGRSRLASLFTLNAALMGDPSSDWTRLTTRLADRHLLPASDAQAIERLWWFGRLIANSDMHTGNLSFVPQQGRLSLAPCYDMLPMAYAPLPGGEVPLREFRPPAPLPTQRGPWTEACDAARRFWSMAGDDDRISLDFRSMCIENAQSLAHVAMQV
ncbi:type II toxin-antitoxin system HipA family toxin YjjJ [Piscinibacter terrae]|uniref:Type II toxin-antitoxin system HipA family toxinoxin YjjJ n=1 Tax=Piscinibacter terrae TaxID=2496871 RepID=A0A3N7HTX6_9BURK|nr:type II toxin-antitoxin system HipA family toxin YjjJ [Albitalea terrae]RQP25778.1 type II toxin-antitoxin system HipA family toxinoxin YjjJ [Albitalea terrae]